MCSSVKVGARDSALSCAQVEEVHRALLAFHPHVEFETVWLQTKGDRDLSASLRQMDKSNFFTDEIDARQLANEFRISIHSAKDLPEPLAPGLEMIALTACLDPTDVLVFASGQSLEQLPLGAVVGTSTLRREVAIQMLRSDLICKEIRGPIHARLEQLDRGDFAAVVMAEAAILRLQLAHRDRIPLPGESAPLQGQLAVVACTGDEEMKELFSCIDTRSR